MPKTILITAAKEDAYLVIGELSEENVLHAPLEVYDARDDDARISDVLSKLDEFENIVYSSVRNARFFLDKVDQYDARSSVKDRLNLAINEAAFTFLEGQGIPAVYPKNGNKPIDLMELMLRLKRTGATLYPCGSHKREDFPGFLEELDIPVTELDLFDLEGPREEQLASYHEQMAENAPDVIIFHSRRSVNRTMAAFPDLDYQNATIISADKGITKKLNEKEIEVDTEADGSWESIAGLL